MRIPNASRAVVDVAKLSGYCLNSKHPSGKHKARLFESLLGLRAEQAEELREAILKAVISREAAVGEADAYGERYTVDFEMVGPDRSVAVRAAWIVLRGEDFPRLTTCYIL